MIDHYSDIENLNYHINDWNHEMTNKKSREIHMIISITTIQMNISMTLYNIWCKKSILKKTTPEFPTASFIILILHCLIFTNFFNISSFFNSIFKGCDLAKYQIVSNGTYEFHHLSIFPALNSPYCNLLCKLKQPFHKNSAKMP